MGFARFIVVSFIGLSILGYTKNISIYDYQKYNWKKSKLLQTHMKGEVDRKFYHYKISAVLYYIMKGIGNIEYVTTSFIDKTFNPTDKYSETPNGLYRSFVYAGYAQITDTNLQSKLNYYQSNCINPIIAKVQNKKTIDKILDTSFLGNSYNSKIRNLFNKQNAGKKSCSKLRKEVNKEIKRYLKITKKDFKKLINKHYHNVYRPNSSDYSYSDNQLSDVQIENYVISSVLANHFNQKTEDKLIESEAKVSGITGVLQNIMSPFIKYFVGGSGSASAAEQANNFSDAIKKAPHIKGFFLLILIGGFPILTFFIIAYGLKPLKIWVISYFMVSMWMPIWALLYAVNINFAKNAELISHLQNFSDGISMYSAKAINSQILRSYSVFFIGQMGVVAITLIGFLKPIFSGPAGDKTKDDTPSELTSVASKGAKFTSGGMV